jgi:hypothetical protein
MNKDESSPVSSKKEQCEPIVSRRTDDGTMLEAIVDGEHRQSRLIVFRHGKWSEATSVVVEGRRYVPYSARNNLLTHGVIRLPSAVGDYDSESELLAEVQQFIHQYMDLEPAFEEVAAHYVLMSWGYDTFNELPYLRVRGDYGSGKSRFLLTVGALCYKPLFASGASTVSPIFRMIDQIGGTLVLDEADFRLSDERAEITKILNCGFARGFPLLRSQATPTKEFNPRAFNIFGPKLVATRHRFEDEALESRCLTAVLGERAMRSDIPVSLPRTFDGEAERLRNKLLSYRFRRFCGRRSEVADGEQDVDPRRAQISAALLSVATSAEARARLTDFLRDRPTTDRQSRFATERRVLVVVRRLIGESSSVSLQLIAKGFQTEVGHEYGVDVSPRWIGSILRRLGIQPQKSNGNYVISISEFPRLRALFLQHGVVDVGDERDLDGGVRAESMV